MIANNLEGVGKILTANRLNDGIVVFLRADNVWTENVNDAVLAREEKAAEALAKRGTDFEASNHVTGAYLLDAERSSDVVTPQHVRERIRANGPSILEVTKLQLPNSVIATETCHV